jgi:hypothetical protein
VSATYKNDLSITSLGHTSMHCQQAVQAKAFNWTNAVCVLSFCINVDFIFFQGVIVDNLRGSTLIIQMKISQQQE